MSTRIINGDTTAQLVSFTQLIFINDAAIIQNLAFGNTVVVPDLVEHLEILLEPYKDDIYKKDIEELYAIKPRSANTPIGITDARKDLYAYRVNQKHKALMRLAKRQKLLPIKGAPNEL